MSADRVLIFCGAVWLGGMYLSGLVNWGLPNSYRLAGRIIFWPVFLLVALWLVFVAACEDMGEMLER